MSSKRLSYLLNEAPAAVTGVPTYLYSGVRTIQATISGTGSVSGTVEWYGSNMNDVATGLMLATSNLSGTNIDSTGGALTAEYVYMWAKIPSGGITGTDAKITATVSV